MPGPGGRCRSPRSRHSGNEQHLEPRTKGPARVGDLTAVQAPGQTDIGDQKVDSRPGLQTLRPAGPSTTSMALKPSSSSTSHTSMRTVASSSTTSTVSPWAELAPPWPWAPPRPPPRPRRYAWADRAHGGPLALLRIDPHLPARLPGEAVDHRQAQPGAHAEGLGGEERIERARDHFGRHAGSGVGHAQRDILSGRQVPVPGRPLVEPFVGGLDGQPAPVGHGVARVDAQLSSAFSSWCGSIRVGQTPAAPTTSMVMPGPTVRRIRSLQACDQAIDVDRLGIEVWRREKARSRWVSAAARFTAPWAAST